MHFILFFLIFIFIGCSDDSAELTAEIEVLTKKTQEFENTIKEIRSENSAEKTRSNDEKSKLLKKIENLETALKREQQEKIKQESNWQKKIATQTRLIAEIEEHKISLQKDHAKFIDTLRKDNKKMIARMQNEIRRAEADGYKRGIDEMISRMNKSRGL